MICALTHINRLKGTQRLIIGPEKNQFCWSSGIWLPQPVSFFINRTNPHGIDQNSMANKCWKVVSWCLECLMVFPMWLQINITSTSNADGIDCATCYKPPHTIYFKFLKLNHRNMSSYLSNFSLLLCFCEKLWLISDAWKWRNSQNKSNNWSLPFKMSLSYLSSWLVCLQTFSLIVG